ncbi:DUF3782 domain-containing protein [Thiocapsa roseopersicina]|nr:DUF3782 domain-containing protein [Thiocapsa roseopersicina]
MPAIFPKRQYPGIDDLQSSSSAGIDSPYPRSRLDDPGRHKHRSVYSVPSFNRRIDARALIMTTTAEEVWGLLRELAQSQQETDRRMKDTDRQIRELGKQIGGLGEKFGSFTEGLALPSMENILRTRFGMEVVSPSVRVTKDGRHLEIYVLSYANGPINAAYVVEAKSHAREESITQMKALLARFRQFFPEHSGKRL